MMRRIFKIGYAIAMAIGVVAMGTSSHASTITWMTSVDLFAGGNNDMFVSTNGTLAAAVNYTTDTSLSPVLNGVTFVGTNASATATGGTGETIALGGGGDNTGAFGDGAFSSMIPIFDLLRSGAFNIPDVTLGGLVPNTIYEIQIFSHDGRGSRNDAAAAFGDGTGSGPVGELDLNNTGLNINAGTAGTGDFITGTFLATSATKTFQVFGDGNLADNGGVPNFSTAISQAAINAIQLRAIEVIPEPSSLALLGLMGLGMAARRRKE